ncbi:MAG: TolC family protein [Sulfuricellaceae bacterium]|nr:TolC family protein [Sulfuricellaceae bacterium]
MMPPRWQRLWLAGIFCCASAAGAADAPLTLSEALKAADANHPDITQAVAERDVAVADEQAAAARSDLAVNLEAGLRRVRPSLMNGGPEDINDHSLRLNARKTLYDFGRTRSAEDAARQVVEARNTELLDARERHRLDIMARFFNVLIADMQASADNEYMSVAFVDFDHGKDRLAVGTLSQVDLDELEHRYQEALVKRNLSQVRQRITRSLLANAMNQPGNLRSDLVDPVLDGNQRKLPDYDNVLPSMLENNRTLRALRQQLAAAQKKLEEVRDERGPTLDAELEGADYATRKLSGRDDLRMGLVLNWPLYQGGRVEAKLAREQALFHKLQAAYEKQRLDLSQTLLETLLRAEQLQSTVRNAAKVQSAYRDEALERARGQYEVELKTNLGTAMAETMDAKLRERRTEYQLALSLAQLDALLGTPLESIDAGSQKGKSK